MGDVEVEAMGPYYLPCGCYSEQQDHTCGPSGA